MYLYHGTSAAALPSILENGIMPRTLSGVVPNSDQFRFQGHPDCVYLANGYASFYAAETVYSFDGFTGEAAILEIDTDLLDKRRFRPDEFVMADGMTFNPNNKGVPFEDLVNTARIVMADYSKDWTASLHNMGTCAYGGVIPSSAIRRVSFIDFRSMKPDMLFTILDISVSVQAYLAAGKKYRMVEAWFMGGKVDPGFGLVPPGQACTSVESLAAFNQLWQDRSMIRVERCPGYKKRR